MILQCMVGSVLFFLMIRRPPRSTLDRSSAASDVYKRQIVGLGIDKESLGGFASTISAKQTNKISMTNILLPLSLIHISEPTRPY